MRVTMVRLLPLFLVVPMIADEPAWLLTAEQRAVRRADPVANAARHQAWVAKGQPVDVTSNLVDGSIDPTILAPIELMDHLIVHNLEPQRMRKFRGEWYGRGAARLLGADYWERLESILAEMISLDRENRRINTLPDEERAAARAAQPVEPGFNDNGECVTRSKALTAARQEWGVELFDRFLYEVVAPGVSFWSSSSAPDLMQRPEHWLEEWKWMEGGCR